MDIWVVAAATGAGYLAKYWRNLTSREREVSSESLSFDPFRRKSESRNFLQQIRDQTNPLHRLGREQPDIEGFLIHRFTNNSRREVENHEDYNLLSLTSFPPVLRENENFRGNRIEGKSDFSNISMHLRSSYYGNFLEPLDSFESRLIAQLYGEYATMEEYVYNSTPSPTMQAVRPLLLTDGRRIISRASRDFNQEVQLQNGEYNLRNEVGFQQNEMQLLQRKIRKDIRRNSRRLSMMRESSQAFSSQGSSSPKLLYFLGITVGVMYTVLANQREMESLSDLLKENENLVQDLHEELEMKQLLNVKELKLPDEGFESWETKEHPLLSSGTPNALYAKLESNISNKVGREEPEVQKAETSEEMSKIEAELEAELEQLEMNMRTYSLERISDYVELDPDFETDVVRGDLKLDQANRETGDISDSDHEASGTSTDPPDSSNYAVSPRELSLRLHTVIQSRLEARIMELETAVENSQKKLHCMELERINRLKDIYGEAGSSSHESQTLIDEDYNEEDTW